jgi:hypothetical protein
VQRKLWKACKCRWADFFKKIDWVQGENMAYRKWPEEFKWVRTAPLSRASPRTRARARARECAKHMPLLRVARETAGRPSVVEWR